MRVLLMAGFHSSERVIHRMASVEDQAHRAEGMLRDRIPAIAARFLEEAPLVAISTVEGRRIVASPLFGASRRLHGLDQTTVIIDRAEESIRSRIKRSEAIGLVAIDFETRRRMRLNGRGRVEGEQMIISAEQVYSNCARHIRPRMISVDLENLDDRAFERPATFREVCQVLERADTFFVASYCEEGGADVSHRGGDPGFIRVISDGVVEWHEFAGNNLFNTLGNFTIDPRVSLLVVDHETGDFVRLAGSAIVASPNRSAPAKFSVAVEVDRVERLLLSGAVTWQPLGEDGAKVESCSSLAEPSRTRKFLRSSLEA